MTNKAVIIVAGGKGKRFGSDIPKQFLKLNDLPVLMHTINKFYNYSSSIRIILVLPFDDINFWNDLCKEHNFTVPHKVVEGGAERFYSVKNGLQALEGIELVAIHDGVRPLVSDGLIRKSFDSCKDYGAIIPVVSVDDSMRAVSENGSIIVDRSRYRLVQTPQVFHYDQIRSAYECEYKSNFTDDASVYENKFTSLELIEGEKTNIKITNKSDIKLAEFYLSLS
ncbi:MAG: 2-C-methyl-D-erythritol 4-phosphate cytidylyltransferase [Hyphomicrobiales bacterium]